MDEVQVPNNTPITPSEGHKKRVLCIEDEHFIGELYARALEKAGYQIDLIVDGHKGLAAAQSDLYDIILLDPVQTPHLHSKIIITTNLEQREELRTAIESQADGYLVKAEITPRELVDFLNRID
jgi:DNA-binding response OmpR family regulator